MIQPSIHIVGLSDVSTWCTFNRPTQVHLISQHVELCEWMKTRFGHAVTSKIPANDTVGPQVMLLTQTLHNSNMQYGYAKFAAKVAEETSRWVADAAARVPIVCFKHQPQLYCHGCKCVVITPEQRHGPGTYNITEFATSQSVLPC